MTKPLGPYTPVLRSGDLLFVSGQVGLSDGALVDGGVTAQAEQALSRYIQIENDDAKSRFIIHCGDITYHALRITSHISRINSQTKKVRNFDVRDGLQGDEFANYVSLKTTDGEMLFGGNNGFNIFHPDSIKSNDFIPPIVLTDYLRYNTDDDEGKPIYEKGISLTKKAMKAVESRLHRNPDLPKWDILVRPV